VLRAYVTGRSHEERHRSRHPDAKLV